MLFKKSLDRILVRFTKALDELEQFDVQCHKEVEDHSKKISDLQSKRSQVTVARDRAKQITQNLRMFIAA